MQLKGIFFLVLFSGFLLLPAVVALTDLDMNITSYFSMTEEESNDTFKVEPSDRTTCLKGLSLDCIYETQVRTKIESRYLTIWKTIYFDTLSPPPEGLLA